MSDMDEKIARELMAAAGQKMGPRQSENPMADYMQQRTNSHTGDMLYHGGMAGAGGLAAMIADNPWMSALMLGGVTAPGLALASQDYNSAQRMAQGKQMWSNTGMPGRPSGK